MSTSNKPISGREVTKVEHISVGNTFLVACLIGSATISLGVYFNSKALAILMPLIVMALYIFFMSQRKVDLPTTVVGDSFYYMGFIFTLISLVVSLLSLSANEGVNMNSIVGSFGAALLTTILGLVARLVVTSFSVRAKDRRERLENEIENSLTKFSAQLEVLTQEVTDSLTKVHSKTSTSLENSLKNYEKMNSDISDQYKSSMQGGQKSIRAAMEDFADRINQIEVSKDMVSKPLNESLSEIRNTLVSHQQSYGKVNKSLITANNKLSDQLSKSGEQIQQHMNTVDSALASAVKDQAAEYKKSLSEIGNSIMTSLGEIKDLKLDTQDSLKKQLSSFNNEIEELSKSIEQLRKPISSSTKQLENGCKDISDSLHLLSDASKGVQEMIGDVDLNLEKVTQLQTRMDNLSETVFDFNKGLRSSIELNSSATNKLDQITTETEKASLQVAKDIGEVYGQLANQIKALRGPV